MKHMPEPVFELPQSYETSIVMRQDGTDVEREYRFLCAAIAAIHEDHRALLENPTELLSTILQLGESKPLRVAELPDAIFTLLTLETLDEETRSYTGSVLDLVSNADWLSGRRGADPDAVLFAEYLAFAKVVPFELSDAEVHPLTMAAMKSYKVSGEFLKATPHAVILGPKGPIAFMTIAGGVAVIDSIGVIIGLAISPVTRRIVERVRRGIKRLFSPKKKDEQPAQITIDEQFLDSLSAEDKQKLLQALEEEQAKLQAEQEAKAQELQAKHDAEQQELEAKQKADEQERLAELHAKAAKSQAELNIIASRYKPKIVKPPDSDKS
jgi:hypothetical protein